MKIFLRSLFIVTLLASPTFAVKTSHWTHTSQADFEQGTFDNVVASNLGDLKLSREVKTLLGQDPRVSAVYCLAQTSDGTIYAGTGPEGVLLAVKDDKVSTVAEFGAHTHVYSLLVDSKGRLLIGIGGEKGEVYRLDPTSKDKPKRVFASDGVQYIWAMTQTADGNVYAATGPTGKLFEIAPDGKNKVLVDTDENNLLCILADDKDFLYVGTDPDGLVYRINRKSGEIFVVYDAPESEITSLARDGKGNIYAATGEATETQLDDTQGTADQVGRPDAESPQGPIPSQPPSAPQPPELPPPSPGDPLPIPKQMAMQIEGDEPAAKASTTAPSVSSTPTKTDTTATSPAQDNAIYKIDPEGFVTEVFREPVTVFAMIEQAGKLLVATGGDGELYQVDPDAGETLILAKVDPKHILSLLPTKDGRVFMGLADSGDIAAMTPGFAQDGTFTSAVLDATQTSRFGKMQLHGTLPAGTTLTVATRSGNVEEESDPGWSEWSKEIPATQFLQVPSPTARFLQYRLHFTSNEKGDTTPIVQDVDVAYQVPNLAPQIKSVKITEPEVPADDAKSDSKATITWEASDANEDELQYELYFRRGINSPWILLKDKLKEATFDWDTRTVGDGRYEIKVVATDAIDNPPGQEKTASRVSDPIIVDNTPPLIGDLKTEPQKDGVAVSTTVADQTTTVASLAYCVDSSEDWHGVLPSDNIADSPQEAYRFVVGGLSSGQHSITLRATDEKGNRAFESLSVKVGKDEK